MIPHNRAVGVPEWASPAEFHALLLRRIDAIAQCTAQLTGGRPMPVSWRWGWKAHIRYAGRSKDGSLLATITVTGPNVSDKWLQRVRLVPRSRLNHRVRDKGSARI